MPSQRPEIRTFQEALRAGGVAVINGYRALGYRGRILDQAVEKIFTNLPPLAVADLRRYAVAEARAARSANAGSIDALISPPSVTINQDVPGSIQYTILVQTNLTVGDGQSTEIVSDVPLSLANLTAQVEARLFSGRQTGQRLGYKPATAVIQEVLTNPIQVLLIERGPR